MYLKNSLTTQSMILSTNKDRDLVASMIIGDLSKTNMAKSH
jgi:hypothetical protein